MHAMPLQVYHSGLNLLVPIYTPGHRRTGTSGLGGGGGAVTFLPEKITQFPKEWGLKPGCKRRRSSFSHLMKLLSLEK